MTPPPNSSSNPFARAEMSFSEDPVGELGLVEASDTITVNGGEMPVDIFVEYGEEYFPGTTPRQRLNKVFDMAILAEPGASVGVSEELQLLENDLNGEGFVPVYDELGQLNFKKLNIFIQLPISGSLFRLPDDIFGFSLSTFLLQHDIQLGSPFHTSTSGKYWPRQGVESLSIRARDLNRKIEIKIK